MCDANCEYAFLSFPAANDIRQLELTEPLHFIADGCGNIHTDPAAHGVRNGALATITGGGGGGGLAGLVLQLKLVLPSSIGCNRITIETPPILYVTIDGDVSATMVPSKPQPPNKPSNVFFYDNPQPCRSSVKAGSHCITSISIAGTDWGKISLGCDCNQQDECLKVPASLWLVRSDKIDCGE
jgi:hypothetical protein